MLNVTVIEPSGLLYGSEFCLLDVLDGLPRERFCWDIVMPSGGGFDKILTARGLEYRALLPRFLHRRSRLRKVISYSRLYRHLRSRNPDLIYLNQAGLLRVVAMCARRLSIPVVCQVQTLEDARLVGKRRSGHSCVQSFICNSEFIGESTDVDREKKSILYQGIAASNESGQRTGQAHFSASTSDRDHVTSRRKRSQTPTCERTEQKTQTDESAFTVGILGRIAESKGHYLLVEAARRLVSKLPEIRFVVIGEGITPEETDRFVAAVGDAGVSRRFEMRGYQRNLQSELARVDLLAIPSPAEPLGRVLFDAAEYGVPVVLSDGGGLGEISSRYEIGVRFRSGDADDLAAAICQSARDYEKVQANFRSAACRLRSRLCMAGYLQSMSEILERSARREPCSVRWFGVAD